MLKKKKTPHPDLETIMPLLMGIWRRFHKLSGPPDVLQTREFRRVVSAVEKLEKGFEDGKSLIGQDYFINPELLGAYLLYQWVIHYLQGLSLINEIPQPITRVLDVCSGPCSFGFAALRHGATEVIAIDRNQRALELGAEVCGRYGKTLSIRRWEGVKERIPVEGKFDLIVVGHCLEELFPTTSNDWKVQQHKFLTLLLDKLSPEGHLLLVDNSFMDANRRLLQLRDLLVQEGVPIQAPCVWQGQCPALQATNSPCYAQREFEKPFLIKEIQRAAKINLSSLKMTYLIFKNPSSQWPQLTKEFLYRIISPPVESFHGKRYYLCGTDGKKNFGSHLKEHPIESRAFDFLRRGELISVENGLENLNALDIIQGTKVDVVAATGKPIPEKDKNPYEPI